MKLKKRAFFHALFWSAYWITAWDLYQEIISGKVFHIHHGYLGLFLVALSFVALTWDFYFYDFRLDIQKFFIRRGRIRHSKAI